MKELIINEVKRLRQETRGLRMGVPHERKMYQLLVAQICILEKILKGGEDMEKTPQQKALDILIDIEGYLIDNNPKDCLDYVLQAKKELIADIKKDAEVGQLASI